MFDGTPAAALANRKEFSSAALACVFDSPSDRVWVCVCLYRFLLGIYVIINIYFDEVHVCLFWASSKRRVTLGSRERGFSQCRLAEHIKHIKHIKLGLAVPHPLLLQTVKKKNRCRQPDTFHCVPSSSQTGFPIVPCLRGPETALGHPSGST
jgi:hypothetical protein